MLKKFFIVFALIVATLFYFCESNGILVGEKNFVYGGKSAGVITDSRVGFMGEDGVFIERDKNYNYQKLIDKLNAKKVYEEEVEGVTCYYFCSNKIGKTEVIGNKKVNIHVAVSSDKVIVGIPIIYGGF